MVIFVQQNILANLPDILAQSDPYIFDFSVLDFKFSDNYERIFTIFDDLILRDAPWQIVNLPFCWSLGYDKYQFFTTQIGFIKIDKCQNCVWKEKCAGVSGDYLQKYGASEIKPLGYQIFFSNLEKCFLKILNIQNNINTRQVLTLAKTVKLCASCDDGSAVLSTGEDLIQKGLITREFRQGEYYWRLADPR